MIVQHYHQRPNFAYCLAVFSLLYVLLGCAAPGYRVHPDFENRVKSIDKPVLMPPDVKVYERLPGGLLVLRDDWSTLGQKNLMRAVVKSFREKHCDVRLLEADVKKPEELAAIQSLYKVVDKSIRLQAYGSRRSAEDQPGFKYSIGSIEDMLRELKADSMIFVCGRERVSKGDSSAVVNLAVADPSGTIIWYSVEGCRAKRNLQDSDSTQKLVNELIFSFPKVGG